MAQETFDDIPLHNLTTCQSIGDFTEAAVRSGHRDEALALVREREALAARQRRHRGFTFERAR